MDTQSENIEKVSRLSIFFNVIQCLIACFSCPKLLPFYNENKSSDSLGDYLFCYTSKGFQYTKDNRLYKLSYFCITLDYIKNTLCTFIWFIIVIIALPIIIILIIIFGPVSSILLILAIILIGPFWLLYQIIKRIYEKSASIKEADNQQSSV